MGSGGEKAFIACSLVGLFFFSWYALVQLPDANSQTPASSNAAAPSPAQEVSEVMLTDLLHAEATPERIQRLLAWRDRYEVQSKDEHWALGARYHEHIHVWLLTAVMHRERDALSERVVDEIDPRDLEELQELFTDLLQGVPSQRKVDLLYIAFLAWPHEASYAARLCEISLTAQFKGMIHQARKYYADIRTRFPLLNLRACSSDLVEKHQPLRPTPLQPGEEAFYITIPQGAKGFLAYNEEDQHFHSVANREDATLFNQASATAILEHEMRSQEGWTILPASSIA